MADRDTHPELSQEEYLALSEQKAQDWRWISGVNPTMFAAAGALLAAGITREQGIVVGLSPLPLFLSVWHMVRQARLQLQMITYLDVFAARGASWERDIAVVRDRYWKQYRKLDWKCARVASVVAWLKAPQAWTTWLVISIVIAIPVEFIPLLAGGFHDACLGLLIGIIANTIVALAVARGAVLIMRERIQWAESWREYKTNG